MDDPCISGRSLILPNIFPITLHLFGLFPGKSLSKFCVKSTSLQFEASVNNFYPENMPSFTLENHLLMTEIPRMATWEMEKQEVFKF